MNSRAAAAPGRVEAEVRSRANRHPLLKELGDTFARARASRSATVGFPPELRALVTSDHCISALLLAVEWREMALLLTPDGPAPAGVPELYLIEHAMALRSNRGPAEADEFLSSVNRSTPVDCLRGEVLLALKKTEEGRLLLQPHAGLTNRHGMRAAYLLGIDALERKAWDEGRGFIRGNASLAGSIQGRERVGANTLRILLITVAALTFSPEFAMGTFHNSGGLVALLLSFGLAVGGMRLVLAILHRTARKETAIP